VTLINVTFKQYNIGTSSSGFMYVMHKPSIVNKFCFTTQF